MNKVFLVGQRPLKEEDQDSMTRLMFFSNKEFKGTKRAFWFSGLPDDYVEEPVSETIRWMESEELNQFYLQLIYD
jgi:hypothetical protein